MRTRTVCGVSRGDAPLTLRWLKDGEPLPSILGANVTSLDQYSSLLSIPSLSAKHSGDYTCVATNPAAEFKFTASLQVKGTVLNILGEIFKSKHQNQRNAKKSTKLVRVIESERERKKESECDFQMIALV